MRVSAFAPGRVNLIGDHTDHTGGFVLPMAIHLGTTVVGSPGGDVIRLVSDHDPEPAEIPLGASVELDELPSWARYIAGVVAGLNPALGFEGVVTTTLPIGAGLSSSASLTVAVALALGAEMETLDLARLCQRAERDAVGVPCGLMDPLVVAAGVEGAALLIDTETGRWTPVNMPTTAEVVVIDSGQPRSLAESDYADVRERCVRGEPAAARHVECENARVRQVAELLPTGALAEVGELMVASHRSLAELGVSTPELDAMVDRLVARPGVFGARLTGAGFGGCVVALCEPDAIPEGWVVRPSRGARVSVVT